MSVFAYYLLAFPTYGESVANYTREIQEAQAIGIDGFLLNAGAWSTEPYHKTRAANIFAAAKALNSGFKLYWSVDMSGGLSSADVQNMVSLYANHTNYFRYQSRPMLAAWQGQDKGETFWHNLLRAGSLKRYNIFFVPYFFTGDGTDWLDPAADTFGCPNYDQVKANYDGWWWKNVVDGLMYYAASGSSTKITESNAAMAQLMRDRSKAFAAGIIPYFWEGRLSQAQPELLRRYHDTHGGEGIAEQWAQVRADNPPFVVIDTWNDYTESYLSPAAAAEMPLIDWFYNVGPLLKSHAGYSELFKYFIAWFKTGAQPAITQDKLFAFYRTHPKDLIAPNDTQNIVQYEVEDNFYITTLLTAPATLRVNGTDYPIAAGLAHTRAPLTVGTPNFQIIRNSQIIIDLMGDPVDGIINLYNFTTTSAVG